MTDRSFSVETAGGSLRVWDWGPSTAPVIVALHGITAHGRSFRALAERLPGLRVLAPDLRGRGGSRHITGPFSIAAHADDLVRVLDTAEVDDAVVLGHSMGGFVGVVAADRHADRVRELVLVDGGVPLDLPEEVRELPAAELVGAVIGPALERLRMTFPTREAYRRLWRNHPALAAHWNPIIEAYVDEDLVGEEPELRPGANEEAVLRDGESELVHDDVEQAIAALDTPTTFLAAEHGLLADDAPPLYADEQLEAFAAAHPEVTTSRVPGVNHYTVLLTGHGADAVAAEVAERVTV